MCEVIWKAKSIYCISNFEVISFSWTVTLYKTPVWRKCDDDMPPSQGCSKNSKSDSYISLHKHWVCTFYAFLSRAVQRSGQFGCRVGRLLPHIPTSSTGKVNSLIRWSISPYPYLHVPCSGYHFIEHTVFTCRYSYLIIIGLFKRLLQMI